MQSFNGYSPISSSSITNQNLYVMGIFNHIYPTDKKSQQRTSMLNLSMETQKNQ